MIIVIDNRCSDILRTCAVGSRPALCGGLAIVVLALWMSISSTSLSVTLRLGCGFFSGLCSKDVSSHTAILWVPSVWAYSHPPPGLKQLMVHGHASSGIYDHKPWRVQLQGTYGPDRWHPTIIPRSCFPIRKPRRAFTNEKYIRYVHDSTVG